MLCNSDLSMKDKLVFMNVQIANIRGLLIIRRKCQCGPIHLIITKCQRLEPAFGVLLTIPTIANDNVHPAKCLWVSQDELLLCTFGLIWHVPDYNTNDECILDRPCNDVSMMSQPMYREWKVLKDDGNSLVQIAHEQKRGFYFKHHVVT